MAASNWPAGCACAFGRRAADVCDPRGLLSALRKDARTAVQQTAGPQSRIRTAQLLPYGVRLDLKLAAAATSDASVLLRFTARSPLAD